MMTAIVLTGRNGAAIAAELGTMRVRGEIDALDAMGISPSRFLLLPRLLALTFVQPALTLIGMFVGIGGGMLVAALSLDCRAAIFWARVVGRVDLEDCFHGLGKSFVFARIIGFAGSHLGMRATGDRELGRRATTRTVVVGIFLIIVVDAVVRDARLAGRLVMKLDSIVVVSQARGRLRRGSRSSQHIDLEVRRGEIVALLGGSGCGKSTLLRTITGLQPPLAGERAACSASACTSSTTRPARRCCAAPAWRSSRTRCSASMTIEDNVALPLRELTKLPEPIICEMVAHAARARRPRRLRTPACRRSSRVASASAPRSPARRSSIPRSSSATSRPPASIRSSPPSIDDTLLQFRDVARHHDRDRQPRAREHPRARRPRDHVRSRQDARRAARSRSSRQSKNEDVYHYFHARSRMKRQRQKAPRSACSPSSSGALLGDRAVVVRRRPVLWRHRDRYFIELRRLGDGPVGRSAASTSTASTSAASTFDRARSSGPVATSGSRSTSKPARRCAPTRRRC